MSSLSRGVTDLTHVFRQSPAALRKTDGRGQRWEGRDQGEVLEKW